MYKSPDVDTFGFSIDASAPPIPVLAPRRAPRRPSTLDRGLWQVLTQVRRWDNQDIDWWRARHGKEEGEARFFAAHEPDDVLEAVGNMVLGNGVASLWQFAMGNGTGTANTALPTPTYYNSSNTYMYVGDGGVSAGSGTASVTNGSGAVTFSTSQSGLQGKYITITGDSSNGLYTVVSGSGTSWTFGPVYGGTTAGSASWSYLTAESHNQTGLSGSTNTASQVCDGGFPANASSAQMNAITAATNASPIVLTISGGDINTNDIVSVMEVAGNTAANGLWVANPASSSSVTLLNSSGSGAWTYGGLVSKRNVFSMQATFGSGSANFNWLEWAVVNGNSTNKIFLNRKVSQMGTKAGGTQALKVGIAVV